MLLLCLRPIPKGISWFSNLQRYSTISAKPYHTSALSTSDASAVYPPQTDVDTQSIPSGHGRNIFADKALVTLQAGSGGNGCISFLRQKYVDDGPANGGDGGTGGSIYIQAVKRETSLHKLARRRIVKAGRGQNGKGKSQGGQRGDDVLLQVPVGTVVREVSRHDPMVEEEEKRLANTEDDPQGENVKGAWRRDKWISYPAATPSDYAMMEFPPLPENRRSHLMPSQPRPPIFMDLSEPMDKPVLLAAGAVGGCGNPHFLSPSMPRPKLATKGERGITLTLDLELKLLADLGFVGMPNAGKSTLLRALTRSHARVGDWAFTTLSPNIGTMILDDNKTRPTIKSEIRCGEPRTHVSIADIPGLISDAHLDKGLGLGFLRHIERAQVLAFVVDLSLEDAVESLKCLWKELTKFEKLRSMETNLHTESRRSRCQVSDNMDETFMAKENENLIFPPSSNLPLSHLPIAPISTKPWFVVATKADIQGTRENFIRLRVYLQAITNSVVEHPSGKKNPWQGTLAAIPVSAMRGEGVWRIPEWTVALLDG